MSFTFSHVQAYEVTFLFCSALFELQLGKVTRKTFTGAPEITCGEKHGPVFSLVFLCCVILQVKTSGSKTWLLTVHQTRTSHRFLTWNEAEVVSAMSLRHWPDPIAAWRSATWLNTSGRWRYSRPLCPDTPCRSLRQQVTQWWWWGRFWQFNTAAVYFTDWI